jgi:predicted esterase
MLARIAGATRRVAAVCLAVGVALAAVSVLGSRDAAEASEDGVSTPMVEAVPAEPAVAAEDAAEAPRAKPAPRWASLTGATELATRVGTTRVVPPAARAKASGSVTTFLHGACMSAEETCARMDPITEDDAWLVCPAGNASCGGDAVDWTGDGEEKAAHLDESVGAALAQLDLPASAEGRSDVLVGFSRGAFVARDVAYARPGRYRGLVLIGAALVPDAEVLHKNGVRRVVLAAGDYDGARRTMVQALAKLCAAGVPTRFVGLGPVWHALPKDSPTRLRDALAWVRAEGDPGPLSCKPAPGVRSPPGA